MIYYSFSFLAGGVTAASPPPPAPSMHTPAASRESNLGPSSADRANSYKRKYLCFLY
jgi:hypothetical protein